MIKFEHTEVVGFEPAVRGMRNPMNSWDKIDSLFDYDKLCMGDNDLSLMKRLRLAGTDHRKYLRMINVYVDITAPLYWWKEFDTYKVGTVANSCSTMHKIQAKEFTLDDFSCEHLTEFNLGYLINLVRNLNSLRDIYNDYENLKKIIDEELDSQKKVWWQMIQLLPSSYNQKRTVMLNYETLNNIYKSRKNHKLDEWRVGFIDWIKTLPYAKKLIAGEE